MWYMGTGSMWGTWIQGVQGVHGVQGVREVHRYREYMGYMGYWGTRSRGRAQGPEQGRTRGDEQVVQARHVQAIGGKYYIEELGLLHLQARASAGCRTHQGTHARTHTSALPHHCSSLSNTCAAMPPQHIPLSLAPNTSPCYIPPAPPLWPLGS